MHYLVYKTTNTVNGKFYIGVHKTANIDDGYLGSGKMIKRAIAKYGRESFTKEVLFEASCESEMFEKERELVVIGPMSYNLKSGGDGGFDYINSSVELRKEKNRRARETTNTRHKDKLVEWAALGARGRIWITNGSNNRRIKPSDVIPDGWRRGKV